RERGPPWHSSAGMRLAVGHCMPRKRSRIDHLKMPFVVTVTVAAGACGGTVVTNDGTGDETGGAGGAASGGSGSVASVGRARGGGTSTGGWPTGGPVSTGGWSTGGTVSTGGWSTGGASNPPSPGPCPSSVPTEGTYCTPPLTMSCNYFSGCQSSLRATCV